MRDLMGNEIEDGDLIADIRTCYAGWVIAGIIGGGLTPGGKIRYRNMWGTKEFTQEKFLLKITPQQALDFIDRKYEDNDYPTGLLNFIDELNDRLANVGDVMVEVDFKLIQN